MLTRYNTPIFIFIFLFFGLPRINAQIKGTIWDTNEIYKVPDYKTLSTDSAIGIVYQGLTYKGQPKNVFAYYSSPGTLTGDRSKDKNLPAVVLVHGGGGTAFKAWAILWAKKGYAAIAMDLRGNDAKKQHIAGGFDEPGSLTPYFTITPDLNEQWMYQAVGDAILAHNLIRSFKEVDSNRTALTGISWGGIISCALAGIDNRFKAVVPVYGCGYLFQSSAMRKDLDKLSPSDRATWIKQYDPSQYIGKAKMPVLFINGTNDGNFFLDSYAKTYKELKDKTLSIKIGLKHNHSYGWGNEEIYYFINSYLNGTAPLAKLDAIKVKKGAISSKFKAEIPIVQAYLNYTKDTTAVLKDRKWERMPVKITDNKVWLQTLPDGITIWYLSVIDKRGLQVSAELQWSVIN
ncbi:Acetyl xylan esterase (AXE1) [compost metagenome]|uniref:alpha/beta hydrolase family protein n=1 Tax=Pedobacter sp. ok626 TaxID=1761882 RepID=UPI000889917E|nr:alpha/beta fold hydrolase [Pedobacter sp. ok626]SDJ10228.1 PhoPQ-activated pathogenicity-related protein [Pedobacter sp. ok626]